MIELAAFNYTVVWLLLAAVVALILLFWNEGK